MEFIEMKNFGRRLNPTPNNKDFYNIKDIHKEVELYYTEEH